MIVDRLGSGPDGRPAKQLARRFDVGLLPAAVAGDRGRILEDAPALFILGLYMLRRVARWR
jgi:hypothetical protein